MMSRLMITFTYFVSVTLAYGLMLVIMSFNFGVFVAIVLGLTIGNGVFTHLKRKKFKYYDNSEENQALLRGNTGLVQNQVGGGIKTFPKDDGLEENCCMPKPNHNNINQLD